jgi:hypothetical protein
MAYTFEDALKAEAANGHFADLARSMHVQESGGGRNTKTSNAGAYGDTQITKGAFGEVADKGWDITNPEHNMRAGIRYLNKMYQRADGDAALAATGYYGGYGGMDKARKGIAVSDPRNPNAPNTLQYGQQVASRIKGGPVQLAQAPEVQAVAPTQVMAKELPSLTPNPVPIAQAPVDMEWRQLQQAMPAKPVQVADLEYGDQMPMAQPYQFAKAQPVQVMQPNFSRFNSWMGKA